MPYAEGRIYSDADSHIMETRDWLAGYIDPRLRDRLPRRTSPSLREWSTRSFARHFIKESRARTQP
jgi:hypothetical protein